MRLVTMLFLVALAPFVVAADRTEKPSRESVLRAITAAAKEARDYALSINKPGFEQPTKDPNTVDSRSQAEKIRTQNIIWHEYKQLAMLANIMDDAIAKQEHNRMMDIMRNTLRTVDMVISKTNELREMR